MNPSKQQTLKERLEGFQTVDNPDIINRFKSAIKYGLRCIKGYSPRREEELRQLAQDPRYHKEIKYGLS